MRWVLDLVIKVWMSWQRQPDPDARFTVIARYQLTDDGREVLREE